MDVPLLLLLSALVSLGARAFSKLCSNMIVGHSVARYTLYCAVTGVVACIFFFVSDGFRVDLNLPTFIFSLIFALLVAASLVVSLWLLKLATISGVNILGGAFGLVLSSAMGFFIFLEEFSAIKLIRIALMLISAFFVFIDERRNNDTDKKGDDLRAALRLLLAVTLSSVIGCFVTLTTKLFVASDAVASENSFFFWTNALLLLGSLLIFALECAKKKGTFDDVASLVRPRNLFPLVGNTLCSNVGSLIAIWLVAKMELSVYTPVSSAIGVVVAFVASLIFREKLGFFSYIAAAVACVAVII